MMASHGFDHHHDFAPRCRWLTDWGRRTIMQADLTESAVPSDPFGCGGSGDAHLGGDMREGSSPATLDESATTFDRQRRVCMGHSTTSLSAGAISRRTGMASSNAAAVTMTATHTGPSALDITPSAAAARTGPAAAPTLSAAVAYEPAMVGAPAAA